MDCQRRLGLVWAMSVLFFFCVLFLLNLVLKYFLLLVQRNAADLILRDLQNNPDTWLQVVHILSSTQNLNTKFFALQVSFILYSVL